MLTDPQLKSKVAALLDCFCSEGKGKLNLTPCRREEPLGCVWELKLLNHEIDSWFTHFIVSNSRVEYLKEVLNKNMYRPQLIKHILREHFEAQLGSQEASDGHVSPGASIGCSPG